MDDESKNAPLDALLDSLLCSYSAADPRPGYQTRLRAVVRERGKRVAPASILMLAGSAAAIVLFAWVMILRTDIERVVPDRAAVTKSIPARATGDARPALTMIRPAVKAAAGGRFAEAHKRTNSRAILEMAATGDGVPILVFEQEKLYLSSEQLPEPQPAVEHQAAAPAISIQDLGVAPIETNAPIEIRDITSPKSGSEKGSL
ncbi:MAG TPA: hypothetical protein VIX19_14590 [Terriglobales bacterium]